MEKIMNFVKGLFVKDGAPNWKTILGIGAGVLLGGTNMFGLLGATEGFSMMGALIGAGVGVGGAALLDMVMPSAPESAVTADVTPKGRVVSDMNRGPQPEITPPGPMGQMRPPVRGERMP